MGAGQGILAADILKYLYRQHQDFFNALEYVIVEKSSSLRQIQQEQLQKGTANIRWTTLAEIPAESITGCFFSNELVDAFPVHQFTLSAGLREIYVTSAIASPQSFEEVIGEPSTPKLAQYFDLISIDLAASDYPDGYRSEVNLAALDWLGAVAERLQRGYLLTIDYGYPAHRYYASTRSRGTLQCYYQHQHHDNPYINIGRQDITAHVDFTALERWGEVCGLQKVGFTQQGLFLMALGMSDRTAAISTTNQPLQQLLGRREALHRLIDPMGLGGFGVLVQSKGLNETQPLKGLMVPVY